MIRRNAIVDEARKWLGTPFVHSQSLRGVGCDCIGLIAGVAAALGVREASQWAADPLYRGYGPLPVPELLRAAVTKYLDPLPQWRDARRGDVLVMNVRGSPDPMHFAFVTEADDSAPRYVLHAWSPIGCVVENGIDAKWARRMVSAHQLRGIE